jgi:hypothetical protein
MANQAKWDNLPNEIRKKMLEHQVEQGNPKNAEVFRKNIASRTQLGGFNWENTDLENKSWDRILNSSDYRPFYEMYPKAKPKSEYPKVMLVKDIHDTEWVTRVVKEKKTNGSYVAYVNCESLEEVDTNQPAYIWDFAKDIEPESESNLSEEIVDTSNITVESATNPISIDDLQSLIKLLDIKLKNNDLSKLIAAMTLLQSKGSDITLADINKIKLI